MQAREPEPGYALATFPPEMALDVDARREITARQNNMVVTQDWNRAPRPLLKNRKGFVIEEWAQFTVVSLHLLFCYVSLCMMQADCCA